MIRQEQAGFRSGRGTFDQVFALRKILEVVTGMGSSSVHHLCRFFKDL